MIDTIEITPQDLKEEYERGFRAGVCLEIEERVKRAKEAIKSIQNNPEEMNKLDEWMKSLDCENAPQGILTKSKEDVNKENNTYENVNKGCGKQLSYASWAVCREENLCDECKKQSEETFDPTETSTCPHCHCTTHTLIPSGRCGKCKGMKQNKYNSREDERARLKGQTSNKMIMHALKSESNKRDGSSPDTIQSEDLCKCGHNREDHTQFGETEPKICFINFCDCQRFVPQSKEVINSPHDRQNSSKGVVSSNIISSKDTSNLIKNELSKDYEKN